MRKNKYEYIFGFHAVRHVFEHDMSRILDIWVQEGRQDHRMHTLVLQAQQQGLTVQIVPKKTLDKQTAGEVHQGIVLRCRVRSAQTTIEEYLAELTVEPFLLVLDGVQDPHNLGACLRTAEAAGVHAVIVPKDRACSLSPIAIKAACGAAEVLPFIQVTNLATTLRELKERDIRLVGTALEASSTPLFASDLRGALALVLGAEESGLRRLTREICDVLIHIPMFGKVESLNVSVATAICLYEAVRQRTL